MSKAIYMCMHKKYCMVILSPIEQAVLKALGDACYWSLSAHVPIEAVTKRIRQNLRGEVKKTLRKLRAKGYCYEHPARRNTTWQLTPLGLATVKTNLLS
jgi:hypothetical protein